MTPEPLSHIDRSNFVEADIDLDIVTKELLTLTQNIAQRILANIEHVQKFTPSEQNAQARIVESINLFLSTYYDVSTKQPKKEAVQDLAKILISKIEIITIEELIETAKKVVHDNKEGDIVLWIPSEKAREANFDSQNSENSNEFMIKLVKMYAKQLGKTVKVVSDEEVAQYQSITVIDDAIYSGRQLSAYLSDLFKNRQKPITVNLYSARATNTGLGKIRDASSENKNIKLNPQILSNLKSLFQSLSDNPKANAFFLASGCTPLLDIKKSFTEIWEYAMNYVTSTTLTISQTKAPDSFSFPRILVSGMKHRAEENHYPRLPKT